MSRSIRRLMLFLALCGASATAVADNFSPFSADSFAEIKKEYAGREFLLGLWSVDCPPCLVELDMMSGVLENNPDLPFVLISTDPIEQRADAAEFLEDLGLADYPSYMFADSFVERLRFSVDPNWFGELPRSYFFTASAEMKSHSGIMTMELLNEWFTSPLRE